MDTDETGGFAGRRTLTKQWTRYRGPISRLAELHPCESVFIGGFFCIVPAWGSSRTQFVPHLTRRSLQHKSDPSAPLRKLSPAQDRWSRAFGRNETSHDHSPRNLGRTFLVPNHSRQTIRSTHPDPDRSRQSLAGTNPGRDQLRRTVRKGDPAPGWSS